MISRSLEFNKGKFFRVLAPPIYAFFYKKSLSWLFKYDGEMLDPFLPMLNFNIKKKKKTAQISNCCTFFKSNSSLDISLHTALFC